MRPQPTAQNLDIEVPLPALVYLTHEAGTVGTLPDVYYEVTCDSFVVADDSFSTIRSGPIPIPSMPSNMRLSIESLEPEADRAPRYRSSRDLMLVPGATLELDFELDFEWILLE